MSAINPLQSTIHSSQEELKKEFDKHHKKAMGGIFREGDSSAQYEVGMDYKSGRGTLPDLSKALMWLQKAAEQGHEKAIDEIKNFEKKIGSKYLTADTEKELISCVYVLSNYLLANGSYNGHIRIWDLRTGKCIKKMKSSQGIFCLTSLSTGELVTSGEKSGKIEIWKRNSGQCIRILDTKATHIRHLTPLSDGKLAVAHCGSIAIWDPQLGHSIKSFQLRESVSSLTILSNDELAAGMWDGTIKIMNFQTGNCIKTLNGHTMPVVCLIKLPNGNLISGSYDGSIRVWNYNSGECIRIIKAYTPSEYSDNIQLILLPTGELLSNNLSRIYRKEYGFKVWDIESGKLIRTVKESLIRHNEFCGALPSGEIITYQYTKIRVWSSEELALGHCEENNNIDQDIRSNCEHSSSGFNTSLSSTSQASEQLDNLSRTVNNSSIEPLLSSVLEAQVPSISVTSLVNMPNSLPREHFEPQPSTDFSTRGSEIGPSSISVNSPFSPPIRLNEEEHLSSVRDSSSSQPSNIIASLSFIQGERNNNHASSSGSYPVLSIKAIDFINSLVESGCNTEKLQQWIDSLKRYSHENQIFDSRLEALCIRLGHDPVTLDKKTHIDKSPKLKVYQSRIQKELTRFICCYYLAPAGLFQLEENKKGTALGAVENIPLESIPIAGAFFKVFLKIFTRSAEFANNEFRVMQINRLGELFINPDQISHVCYLLSLDITLAKENSILNLKKTSYERWSKFKELYNAIKSNLEKIWKDLAVSNLVGIELSEEDKLAMTDGAYLLQQILSGSVILAKNQDLVPQMVSIISGVNNVSAAVSPIGASSIRGDFQPSSFSAQPVAASSIHLFSSQIQPSPNFNQEDLPDLNKQNRRQENQLLKQEKAISISFTKQGRQGQKSDEISLHQRVQKIEKQIEELNNSFSVGDGAQQQAFAQPMGSSGRAVSSGNMNKEVYELREQLNSVQTKLDLFLEDYEHIKNITNSNQESIVCLAKPKPKK